MSKWHKRPRGRKKRLEWLRRYVRIQTVQLKRGFLTAYYRGKVYPAESQAKKCRARIARAQAELEQMLGGAA